MGVLLMGQLDLLEDKMGVQLMGQLVDGKVLAIKAHIGEQV